MGSLKKFFGIGLVLAMAASAAATPTLSEALPRTIGATRTAPFDFGYTCGFVWAGPGFVARCPTSEVVRQTGVLTEEAFAGPVALESVSDEVAILASVPGRGTLRITPHVQRNGAADAVLFVRARMRGVDVFKSWTATPPTLSVAIPRAGTVSIMVFGSIQGSSKPAYVGTQLAQVQSIRWVFVPSS